MSTQLEKLLSSTMVSLFEKIVIMLIGLLITYYASQLQEAEQSIIELGNRVAVLETKQDIIRNDMDKIFDRVYDHDRR